MPEQHSAVEMLGDITVNTDNSYDFGATTKRIKNLYIAGQLKDDTFSLSVADLEELHKRYSFMMGS